LGYCSSLWEKTVFEFMLRFLFLVVLFSDSKNTFTVLTISWWLLLLSSGEAGELVLIFL